MNGPFNPMAAWQMATPAGQDAAKAADDARTERVEMAIRTTILNCGQAVALLTARRDYDRLLRFSNALNAIVARALGSIPDEGAAK